MHERCANERYIVDIYKTKNKTVEILYIIFQKLQINKHKCTAFINVCRHYLITYTHIYIYIHNASIYFMESFTTNISIKDYRMQQRLDILTKILPNITHFGLDFLVECC